MDELAGLTGEARKRALDRFHLLQPHLENDRPLKAVAAAAGIPFRTAQRWVSLYRQLGLAALARRKRTDTGEHREISAKLKEAIQGIALQKLPLPVATICRQARRLAQDLGEEPPSYWLVYRIVTALPADLVTLAHEGTKAYSNAFELVHRREANAPNAIWQADHTPLDILLIRPDGEVAKPWLTTVIDDYSRAVAGYFLSFEDPSALNTSLALRQAIWRKEDSRWIVCGIPDILYTDNGSDFTSQHLEQVGADLKIRLVFSIPGKPRGRGRIERFFSTINEMFLCELDGYAPAGAAVRGKPTLTLAEFDTRFRAFLLDVYHRRENAETKMPPVERWEAKGFLPRMPDSLEQLDLLLIQVAKARQVRVDGIHFQNLRYISTTLAAYVGETVTLRFDPRDMAEIRVFHNDRFLCRAVCAELAGATVPLREIIRVRNRRRHELRGVLRDRQAAVDTLLEMKRGEITEKEDAPPEARDKPQQSHPHPRSSDTNSNPRSAIVETLEHRRFTEFCEACRRYAYIGLCYGPPGVGKTLSAMSYSRWGKVKQSDRWGSGPTEDPLLDTVFYTPPVVNAPNTIQADIRHCRDTLKDLAKRPRRQEKEGELDVIRRRDAEHQTKILLEYDWFSGPIPEPQPTYGQVAMEYSKKELQIIDPTSLILIDEADRLRMASLEQVRAIFDAGEIGVILIGMPGLEKKLARYPQFYSRIGFVHEFRPLGAKEVRELLDRRWTPPGVHLPQEPLDAETVAAVIRITGGNFRLLNRLLTQMERILEINALQQVTKTVVEAARESLVIGQA